MSPGSKATADVREGRPSRFSDWFGTGVCAVVLALATLVTGYVVLTAYVVEPDGPWDSQAVTNSRFAAGTGLAFCVVMAMLIWVFVKAEWLRRWWYAIPVVLTVAALLRLTVLAPRL
ncbi:hypothetical protein AB0K93_09130 [Streptomyces sp. NPDC052676]|uniref:hypothetical protein n=1 Tax=Streptomyces sp. NPDC052676 TaxID=3154953 RepID=UPI00343482FE